jgi:hypothetical protein
MDPTQRIETLKASLFESIAPVWDEPFHEAWMAAEGEDPLVRLAMAQTAELAAARPVIKPGEVIIGNNDHLLLWDSPRWGAAGSASRGKA